MHVFLITSFCWGQLFDLSKKSVIKNVWTFYFCKQAAKEILLKLWKNLKNLPKALFVGDMSCGNAVTNWIVLEIFFSRCCFCKQHWEYFCWDIKPCSVCWKRSNDFNSFLVTVPFWKHQKTYGFLTFPGGIKREH